MKQYRTVPHRPCCRLLLPTMLAVLTAGCAQAPAQVIGYVPTKDAEVTGAQDVLQGHAVLVGSVAVTAKDHTAPIQLGRGGTVSVCQTSVLHLTESRAQPEASQLTAPLLLSLDRGAIEVEMQATPSDALMTPDLRFAVKSSGPLDLRVRLARNGDTCVENRGSSAPALAVSDPFGEATYQVNAGQHVLFEHGSLREVVDHESEPCGCPEKEGMSIADALLAPGAGRNPAAQQATAQHPFPAAQSEGLAPAPEVPQAPAGEVHAQVTQNLSYDGAVPGGQPASSSTTSEPAAAAATPAPAPSPTPHRGIFGSIGHFFHRVFAGS